MSNTSISFNISSKPVYALHPYSFAISLDNSRRDKRDQHKQKSEEELADLEEESKILKVT